MSLIILTIPFIAEREAGNCFITIEYVSGEDLKSFIRRSRPLVVGTAIFMAKQVCEGLAGAHRLGVVHRELKPSNITIDKEGNAKVMLILKCLERDKEERYQSAGAPLMPV